MPIAVTCTCGKSMRAKDELAGKRVRCPGCGAAVTIPLAASSPVGAGAGAAVAAGQAKTSAPPVASRPAAARPAAAPRRAAAVPVPVPVPVPADESYDFADDVPPPPQRTSPRPGALEPVGLAAAAVAMPPVAATVPPLPATVSAPMYGMPTSRRGTAQDARRGTGLLHLSGMTIFFLVAVVVIPTVIFLAKIGPVTAVKEWDHAYNAGMEDTSSVVAKAMEAHKSANGIFARKSRDVPKVNTFTWIDEPTLMWRMPDWVEFHGRTTEGRYTGRYYTRTGEVQAVVECDSDELNVTGRVKDSVVVCEIDGKTAEILKPSPEQQRMFEELDALDY